MPRCCAVNPALVQVVRSEPALTAYIAVNPAFAEQPASIAELAVRQGPLWEEALRLVHHHRAEQDSGEEHRAREQADRGQRDRETVAQRRGDGPDVSRVPRGSGGEQ